MLHTYQLLLSTPPLMESLYVYILQNTVVKLVMDRTTELKVEQSETGKPPETVRCRTGEFGAYQ